jgi:serine/threonine-protein kinase RIO1
VIAKDEGLTRCIRRAAAGVRVSRPYGFCNDVLVIELVTDLEGNPAPTDCNVREPRGSHQPYWNSNNSTAGQYLR